MKRSVPISQLKCPSTFPILFVKNKNELISTRFDVFLQLSAIGGLLPVIEERCPALSFEFDFLAGNILALRPYDL